MAAVAICSDFGAPKNKVWHCFHCLPVYFPWSDCVPSLKPNSYHIPILFTICHLSRWRAVGLRESQVEMVKSVTRRGQHWHLFVTWLVFLLSLLLLHHYYPFVNSEFSTHGVGICYSYYRNMLCWCFWDTVLFFPSSSVQFSPSFVSDSLRPHELQHARSPCPSPTPVVYSNKCPLSRWCNPTISSFVIPFSSCPQSLPASGPFPRSQLFAWGGQSLGISALVSVLPMNIQGWFPLGWTGWISLQSKRLSRVFSNTTVQKHQFFGAQLSL